MQVGLSVLFGLATLATTLNVNGVTLLQPDQLDLSLSNILSAVPGTLIFLALLGALPSMASDTLSRLSLTRCICS